MTQIDFKKALEIRTASGSTYDLGSINKAEIRDVRRRDSPLPFKRCKLEGSNSLSFTGEGTEHITPVIGEKLMLKPIKDNLFNDPCWRTSVIISIKQAGD